MTVIFEDPVCISLTFNLRCVQQIYKEYLEFLSQPNQVEPERCLWTPDAVDEENLTSTLLRSIVTQG